MTNDDNKNTLRGKVALVTGANRGIGAEICRGLAQAGASVVAACRQPESARELVQSIVADGGIAISCALDVTGEDSWQAAVASTVEQCGGLDILVNNAGVMNLQPITDLSIETFRQTYAVNVEGVFLGMKHVIRAMRPGGAAGNGGAIVNIGSVAGNRGVAEYAAYGSSKGAVSAMTRHAAVECAANDYGIRVNQINPGVVMTDMTADSDEDIDAIAEMHPLGVGYPEDIVPAVIYFGTSQSRWVTGAELNLDGGFTMRA